MKAYRFWILVSIVAISGFSQGMLLPLISIILEGNDVSSFMNGLNATALYIGILLISPFMEHPLRKYGYKPVIIFGASLVVVSLFLFTLWKSFWFWFILRLLVGIGDHSLHFATQTWITSFSSKEKMGRNISIYGLFFGIGFAAGPMMSNLVTVNESLPFMISSGLCLIGWLFLFLLKNDFPDVSAESPSFGNTISRFSKAWKYGWVALLPPLGYGFLESSLNGIFPVYALRQNIEVADITLLLLLFSAGGILTQLPLGMLSDRIGRKRVLLYIVFFGFISFTSASWFEDSIIALNICFLLAGMLLGSTFSLGIGYMTDLMPRDLLPTGNLLCGIFFSVGSLIGPFAGGGFIQLFENSSFFHIISVMLLLIFFALVFQGRQKPQESQS